MIALIADDSPTQRALWMYAFDGPELKLRTVEQIEEVRSSGPHVMNLVVAKDGLQAASYLDQMKADLLITDVEMPGMDGWDLAARAQEKQSDLPVLVFSSRVRTGDKIPLHLDQGRTHIIGKHDRERAVALVRSILNLDTYA